MTPDDPSDRFGQTALLMRMPMIRLLPLMLAAFVSLIAAPMGMAQDNLFAPRLIINDRAITNYEVQQRTMFLQLLRAPGDPQKEALKGLTEDRLRMQEAERLGLKVSPDDLKKGMEEFAGRANLDAEKFIAALAQGGVEAQTFRDFVEAGLVWREVVRGRFGPKGKVSEAEVDRAIEGMTRKAALRVLISELIIPAQPGAEAAAMDRARQIKSNVSTEAGFASAVRSYSAAASKGRGGRLDWMPLANLPPAIAPFVLALGPGEVSDPVQIPGGVALFQLRGIEEMPSTEPSSVSVDYAEFLVPNDSNAEAELARIRAQVDTCNDLYGLAKGLPPSQLIRETKPMGEIAQNVALELAKLDQNESSTAITNGNSRAFLMLCARMPNVEPPVSRDEVRTQLINQRLGGFADTYLAELRANAIITEP